MTVYSKDRGVTRREVPRSLGDRAPSYRQGPRERVQVPPNYSGHAIVDGEERPLGTLSAPETPPPLPAPESPTPRFDGLPQISSLGDRRQPRGIPASFTVNETAEETVPEESGGRHSEDAPQGRDTPPDQAPSPDRASEPPRAPTLFSAARSFLSHGLGLEELLLLGLILFLLREGEGEDRGDLDETVILLGLLLLLG